MRLTSKTLENSTGQWMIGAGMAACAFFASSCAWRKSAQPADPAALESVFLAQQDEPAASPSESAPETSTPSTREEHEPEAPPPQWHFELRPYFWLPAMHGEVAIRGRESDVGLNQSEAVDLIDDLSSAYVVHGEVGIGDWSLFADLFYMDLELTQSTRVGNAELDFTQSFFEAGASYEALHEDLGDGLSLRFQPLVGARVYYFDAALRVGALPKQSGSESWVDGFGGFRFRAGAEDGLALIGRVDLGAGGSDLAWNALAGVDWQIASFLSLTAGYRWFSVDYGNGSGTSRTEYDMLLLGPFLGVSFRF